MKYSRASSWHLIKMMLAIAFSMNCVSFPAYSLSATMQSVATTRTNVRGQGTSRQSSRFKQAEGQAKPENLNSQQSVSKIAFASDRSDNYDIYAMNTDGGGLTKLTTDPADDVSPSWSPDGTRIAFVSGRDGNPEIYVMNADGGNQTRLTNNAFDDLRPAFSPDGTKIAFVSNRSGHDQIFVMNADGSNQTNISNSPTDDFGPTWRPDGLKLAFSSVRDGNAEIYSMDANGNNQTRLTNSADDDVSPTWSPGKITFDSFRDGNEQIYVMNDDGSQPARLTNNTAFDSRPTRSADGAKIVFVSTRDGNFEIYIANADGSTQTRLTNDPSSDIEPSLPSLLTVTTPPANNNVVQFGLTNYSVMENAGSVSITVTRTGDTSAPASVEFSTVSGTASDRSDFTPVFKTLVFAAGETSKVVPIFIIDDAFVENDETFNVTLSNPNGATLGSPSTSIVTIIDNDTAPTILNPIDGASFFVRQHYLDFLNRQPDASGLAFWTNEITSCNGDAQCIDIKRQNVSAAFFLSREFQETGFFVIRLQRVAFGKVSIDATKRITFQQFLTDSQAVGKGFVDLQPGADQVLDQNKTTYSQAVAGSQAFITRFPTTLSASAYVDALYTSAGVTPQGTERQDAINAFGSGDTAGRAATLRKVAESISVKDAEFRSAFVLLQYFGYLRRNPTDAPDNNDGGYQFWLGKLNQFNGDYIRSEMVRAFIVSTEYRARFGTP